ncbi:MgtC/SapB family protein [Candidatus Caldatribacterium sp.]|uniref:MgtC/SapB family protein n=1 Tax=Candidatus Caldatribacterium sp. TaxID=2282143 RepID=UPI002994A9AB|nr:MgtC/SapB family protein [Candidatus Caldatribacterium sp.]MDW8081691.1 MgtC/SapB family protein [Candidatus Calescibacterium sp.]
MLEVTILLRLVAAFVAGGVIGWQRERAEKPAGLRTHILVCLGSALMTMVSVFFFASDPARITAQIVSGIGFLGAGTIFRYGATVAGLTTAASLWATCGVGIAMGVGMFFLGFAGVGFILLVLWLLEYFEGHFLRTKGGHALELLLEDEPGALGRVGLALGELGVNIDAARLRKEEGKTRCVLFVHVPKPRNIIDIASALRKLDVVHDLEIR